VFEPGEEEVERDEDYAMFRSAGTGPDGGRFTWNVAKMEKVAAHLHRSAVKADIEEIEELQNGEQKYYYPAAKAQILSKLRRLVPGVEKGLMLSGMRRIRG
jgi:hypothetical protein